MVADPKVRKVKNAINRYLRSKNVEALTKKTQNNYSHALNHHLYAFCERHTYGLEDLMNKRDEFMDFLAQRGNTGYSTQQYCTIVKIFAKKAGYPMNWDRITVSSEERKANKRKQLARWFTEAEVNECLNYKFATHPQSSVLHRIIIRILVETGARVRELAGTQAKHIDIDQCVIWLMDSKTEPRPAFFSPETRKLLIEYKGSKTFWQGKIFPTVKTIQLIVDEMLKDLKLNKPGRGPHTFRHWTATKLFYDGGIRIEDLAMLMGTTTDIVVKKYLHPTPDMLKKRIFQAMNWKDPWEDI